MRVYPRGGGGTEYVGLNTPPHLGLSPRGRGNRSQVLGGPNGNRSIPAGAGEPPTRCGSLKLTRVYPRGGGGTNPQGITWDGTYGLSPAGAGEPDVERRCDA